mmetsp:Transcript_33855/g.83185  ORF Transcript_33855/g.83185 Transcript_33855/m.83185 type:complete len:222 (+) Transcript_33855:11374-12039(+)
MKSVVVPLALSMTLVENCDNDETPVLTLTVTEMVEADCSTSGFVMLKDMTASVKAGMLTLGEKTILPNSWPFAPGGLEICLPLSGPVGVLGLFLAEFSQVAMGPMLRARGRVTPLKPEMVMSHMFVISTLVLSVTEMVFCLPGQAVLCPICFLHSRASEMTLGLVSSSQTVEGAAGCSRLTADRSVVGAPGAPSTSAEILRSSRFLVKGPPCQVAVWNVNV